MNLDPALQTFYAECDELLENMEQSLLRLESAADSPDLINDIFRAAHTIKGSAGVFGFDLIVAFTHQVESLLDKIRDGAIVISPARIALLLECGDHIKGIVEPATTGGVLNAELSATDAKLIAKLKIELGGGAAAPAAATPATSTVEAPPPSTNEPLATAPHWHISLRFGPDVIRNGMDPLSFLRYLTTLGDILHIETLADGMPAPGEMDPEVCYLGFEIALQSAADKTTIESVFDFVRDDCQVHILPPRSKISEYIELIQRLPEDQLQLGDILVRIGALTSIELTQGLAAQANQATPGDPSKFQPLGEILVERRAVDPAVVAAALDKQQNVKDQKAQEARFIRVDSDKLDHLINLVGELVIAGAGTQLLAKAARIPAIAESTANVLRLVEDVRNIALGLRMVPIGATFQRFQRVVRDVSQSLGKDIELVISGADTELDKSVVEKIGDPLMHLVRNSMDHGIESRETRRANGKSLRAKVMLNAYHDSGSIVIEVADDGGGLNRDKILAKARQRGLLPDNHKVSDKEIYNLIFAAGFSTAEQVSDLSGRGVGMDVVRRNIEALRGAVELDSKPGAGTTVRIRLPLTLAIIDGFLIGVAQSRYVIPVDMVVECVEMSVARAASALERGYTDLRGHVLPCLWLRDLFDIEGERSRRENIVVIQFGGHKVGLVVDTLLGESQTVIKPLGKLFEHLNGISGSTILGSGEVALILDVAALIKDATVVDVAARTGASAALAVTA